MWVPWYSIHSAADPGTPQLTTVVASISPEDACQLSLYGSLGILLALGWNGLKCQSTRLGDVTGHDAGKPATHDLQVAAAQAVQAKHNEVCD